MECAFKRAARRQGNPPAPGRGVMTHLMVTDGSLVMLADRKGLLGRCVGTVPQTDTRGWVEYTKVRVRTLAKELGKLAP